jgi:hypothetical protein
MNKGASNTKELCDFMNKGASKTKKLCDLWMNSLYKKEGDK